jgi:O-antigen/teichoic acid export membrane protein
MLSRSLGPADYGRYGVAAAIIISVEYLLAAATSRATLTLLSDPLRFDELLPQAIRFHWYAGLSAALLVWILAIPAETMLDQQSLAFHLFCFAVDIPLFALGQAQRSALAARGAFTLRSYSVAIRWTGRVVGTWVLLPLGPLGAILAWPISGLADLLVIRSLRLTNLVGSGPLPAHVWGHSWPQLLCGAGQRSLERSDLLILQASGSRAETVGLYVAAQNLAMLPSLLASALLPVLLTTLTRERALGREEERRRAARFVLLATPCVLPMAPVLASCAPDVAALIFGSEYRGAGVLAGYLTAAYVGVAALAVATSVMTSQGQARLAGWISMGAALLAACIQVSVASGFGSAGVAVASATVALSVAVLGLVLVLRSWADPMRLGILFRSAAATAIVAAASQAEFVGSVHWIVRGILLTTLGAAVLVGSGLPVSSLKQTRA